jgi:N-acetylmuramoyl-L-alanine amidase
VIVEGLRYWSNPSYTRVVIDANQETGFSHHLLKKDLSLGKPQRLYVDLDRTRLGTGIPKTVPIDDDLLMDARAGQYTPDSVRVVVDIKSFETYKIFSLKNPFRIVIDVWGERRTEPPAKISTPGLPKDGSVGPGSLAQQLALGVRRIVVDPGHGGKDFGAPGYLRGVHEKQIVLEVGRRLAEKLRKRLRCEVVMTRSTDRYLTLEERTAIANTKSADLFVSIHTNSARSRNAYGIETYFLNLATDEDAILVAARENATSTKNISDLQTILSDLMKNAKINESSRLAGHVQTEMVGYLKKRYSLIRSKGVKQAPFYVLLGAQMPAILVETSFISNPRECKRLVDPKYQDHLAEAIAEGIVSYVKETNPAAFSNAASGENRAGG